MPKTGLDALLRRQDSVAVLIVNAVVGLAKGAKVFDVPTILSGHS